MSEAETPTPNRPLRSGDGPWSREFEPHLLLEPRPVYRCDVAIVGAGITGALAAEALSRAGLSVIVVDRGAPGRGSTAASTAMILWEIDTTLDELASAYGFERAAAIYRRSHAAVLDLATLVAALRIPCDWRPRQSLYLGSSADSPRKLAEETRLREQAGLPGGMLDTSSLALRFDMQRPAAILSPDGAEADPVRLAHGLLAAAMVRGAGLLCQAAVSHDWDTQNAYVGLADGSSIEASHVVLATGYDMPAFVPAELHEVLSTWCFATASQPYGRWRDDVLIWEDADPYVYARTLPDGRIIVGGDDAAMPDAATREQATDAKIDHLRRTMEQLWPGADYAPDRIWSAEFGETRDGLPLIGRVADAPRFLAAYGYGGNGITFSYIASRILVGLIAGDERPWFSDFDLGRTLP